jgi:hypothetical protein
VPFTPFHFGAGAAIKAAMSRYFSFTVFCFAQVVTDCETGYYIIRGEYPVHRWLHTYLGATAIAILCIFIGRPVCQFALRLWLAWRDAPFKRYFPTTAQISLISASTGAFIGTYSHVFLDSIMHPDIRPFSPLGAENVFYHLISVYSLHALCILLGISGGWYFAKRFKK